MAAVKGVNRTKADTGYPADILDPGLGDGRIRCIVDSYEASALASGSTIDMGTKIPVGARVLGYVMLNDALGASSTISAGDGASAARYGSARSTASAGRQVEDAVDGQGYKMTGVGGDDQFRLTTGGASITGTINLVVYYTRD